MGSYKQIEMTDSMIDKILQDELWDLLEMCNHDLKYYSIEDRDHDPRVHSMNPEEDFAELEKDIKAIMRVFNMVSRSKQTYTPKYKYVPLKGD